LATSSITRKQTKPVSSHSLDCQEKEILNLTNQNDDDDSLPDISIHIGQKSLIIK
jgi:hypothetical protein